MSREVGMGGERSLVEVAAALRAGELSPVAVTEEALRRAEGAGALNALTCVDRAGALAAARALEAQGAGAAAGAGVGGRVGGRRGLGAAGVAGRRGPPRGALYGVPITVKDLIRTRGLPTTGGSRTLRAEPDGWDALAVARLREAGAILIGKTNLNEFAYGVTGANAHFGDVVNPRYPDRLSGGSSAGSAAALAAGIGWGSVGTDTRGSVRIPAAACGVVGFKPTRGAIPTTGVFPLSRTLDHVGPMARSVRDVALLYGEMAAAPGGGWGVLERLEREVEAGIRGVRIGVPAFFFDRVHRGVAARVRRALALLEGEGAGIVPLEIPELIPALRASAVIAAGEALAVHDARLRARGDRFDPVVRARLEAGRGSTALELVRAYEVRRALIRAYGRAFRSVDVMLGPTLPGPPPRVGSGVMALGGGAEEGVVDASCRLMAPQNLAGTPAISLPGGDVRPAGELDRAERTPFPTGIQLWGPRGSDEQVLYIAAFLEDRVPGHPDDESV